MEVSWSEFKRIVDERLISIQWVEIGDNYHLKAIDGFFSLSCVLPKNETNSDTLDFEENYKSSGNKSPKAYVQTQFEREDLILKIASISGTVDSNGDVSVEFLIPGTFTGIDPNTCEGRLVSGGSAFFNEWHAGDKIVEISIVDKDNVIGYGANTVLKTYHDEEVDSDHEGWYITPNKWLELETLGFYGFIPAGLYLVITAKKGSSQTTGTIYVNIEWGKVSE